MGTFDNFVVIKKQEYVDIGDVLCIQKERSMEFYLFLGYTLLDKHINHLNNYFEDYKRLNDFDTYADGILDGASIRPLYYNFATIGMIQQEQEKGKRLVFIGKEINEKYFYDMLSLLLNGVISISLICSREKVYYNANNTYLLEHIVDKEYLKKLVLKMQLSNILEPKVTVVSLEDIIDRLRKAYDRQDRKIRVENLRLQKVMNSEKSEDTFIQYMVYANNVKDKMRLYVCLGHTQDKEPVFLPLGIVDRETFRIDTLNRLFNVYWLGREIKGKNLLVGKRTRKFYSLGITAIKPAINNLTAIQKSKLRDLGLL